MDMKRLLAAALFLCLLMTSFASAESTVSVSVTSKTPQETAAPEEAEPETVLKKTTPAVVVPAKKKTETTVEETAPEAVVPEEAEPETVPKKTTPAVVVPTKSKPETTAEEAASEAVVVEEAKPETTAEETAPEAVVAEEAKPETLPEETAPQAAVPEEAAQQMSLDTVAGVAETNAAPAGIPENVALTVEDRQKLDASYTLALNAINADDYETAKDYLNVCFVYCDPINDPELYADLLLKRACINVIETKYDLAVYSLNGALRVKPDLADAYLVLTQIYLETGNTQAAVVNLEKYIGLTGETSMYETVAQLNEAMGDIAAAQAAYDKYVEGAGGEVEGAGFQSGLYKMQAGQLEDAIKAFETYTDNETYGAGAMYNIGICRMNMSDYAGAVEAFNASEEKGGQFDGLYYNRGVCLLVNADWKLAADDFTKSAETESYKADARYNLGICQMQQELYEDAVATFSGLIGEQDGQTATVNDAVYYYRAICNMSLGSLEEALADLTTCIDHGYDLSECYYQRAKVYGAMGDTEKQNSDLENSLKSGN